MKTKHTPGPWEAKRDPAHYDTISTVVGGEYRPNSNGQPNRRLIVQVGGFADWREQEANARIIAAAPDGLTAGTDLLDVVKAAIRSGDWKVDGACDPDAAIRRMEQFIAKATGNGTHLPDWCRCENPGPHSKPGADGKFCAVCGKDIQPNDKTEARHE